MEKKFWLSRETFLTIAHACGLDTEGPHLEDLYAYLQTVLPGLKKIDELDLTGLEPTLSITRGKESRR